MPRELISKDTRRVFREWLVTCTLGEIADRFSDAGLRCDETFDPPTSGQRRTLVERYYHCVDWSNRQDVQAVLTAYESILIGMEPRERGEFEALLQRDGFTFDGTRILPAQNPLWSRARLEKIADDLDFGEVVEQMARLQGALTSDPALAIGTSKELLESICKGVIHGCDQELNGNEDLPALVKQCLRSLRMAREDIPDDRRGAEARKRIAAGLATACHGIAELRNIYGTGHGRGPDAQKALERDANLAVGTAATLGAFLAEVFDAQQRRKAAVEQPDDQ